jgi:hypothetical protein
MNDLSSAFDAVISSIGVLEGDAYLKTGRIPGVQSFRNEEILAIVTLLPRA